MKIVNSYLVEATTTDYSGKSYTQFLPVYECENNEWIFREEKIDSNSAVEMIANGIVYPAVDPEEYRALRRATYKKPYNLKQK